MINYCCIYMYMYMSVPPSIRIYPYLIRICARKYGIRKKLSNIRIRNLVTLSKWPAVNVSHAVLLLLTSTHSESVSVGSASDSEHEYESTSYASSSVGPPPRKKYKSMGTGKFVRLV